MDERRRDRRAAGSTRSRRAASSTGSSATRSPTCSGRRSGAASPPAACRRSRCGSSASARTRSRRSCRSSTGRSTRRSEGKAPPPFTARLSTFDGEKLKFDGSDPRLPNEAAAMPRARGRRRRGLEGRLASRAPSGARTRAPPFITSQLQQAAARRLGFAVRRTMQIAQRLYEGREIAGRGTVGLITYMRTDSTRVSQEALDGRARATSARRYGDGGAARVAALLQEPPDAQDAHEAIRPTYLDLPPDEVAKHVAADEAKLYRLIWQRFVASQMAPGRLRHDVGRDHGGPRRLPRLGLDAEVPGLPRRLRDLRRGRGRDGQGLRRSCRR